MTRASATSSTFKSRIAHFLVLSCFLSSIGWQAHRTRAKSSTTLRGQHKDTATADDIISTSSSTLSDVAPIIIKPLFSRPTTKDRRFKSIFYHAYKHLYQTKNSYSRILSAAVEAEATIETTAAAASSDLI